MDSTASEVVTVYSGAADGRSKVSPESDSLMSDGCDSADLKENAGAVITDGGGGWLSVLASSTVLLAENTGASMRLSILVGPSPRQILKNYYLAVLRPELKDCLKFLVCIYEHVAANTKSAECITMGTCPLLRMTRTWRLDVRIRTVDVSVAQSVERRTFNPVVRGSSPRTDVFYIFEGGAGDSLVGAQSICVYRAADGGCFTSAVSFSFPPLSPAFSHKEASLCRKVFFSS